MDGCVSRECLPCTPQGAMELSVMPYPIAVPADVNQAAVMHEAINQCGRHNFIAAADDGAPDLSSADALTFLQRTRGNARCTVVWTREVADGSDAQIEPAKLSKEL